MNDMDEAFWKSWMEPKAIDTLSPDMMIKIHTVFKLVHIAYPWIKKLSGFMRANPLTNAQSQDMERWLKTAKKITNAE